MSAPAQAARDPAPVASAERRVQQEAGHEDGEDGEADPAAAAALLAAAAAGAGARVARARPPGEVPLRVRHAVVHHALSAAHARHRVHARPKAVRRVLAAAPTVRLLCVLLLQKNNSRR